MRQRTGRERMFTKAISKALAKSKSTTRALTSLLKYDVPRGPAKPRSISIWNSTARELIWLLKQNIIEGEPANEYTKKNAARIKARLEKKIGW